MTKKKDNLEIRVLKDIAAFERIYPKWTRVTTDEGYECDDPLYIRGDDGFDFNWKDVVAYDCTTCDGIVLGKPTAKEYTFSSGE